MGIHRNFYIRTDVLKILKEEQKKRKGKGMGTIINEIILEWKELKK